MKMSNGTSRSLVVLVSLISLVLGYDCYNYWSLPPLLRVANLEALKHPYSDKIEADDAFKKHMPIGSDQKFVLDSFQNSGFKFYMVEGKELYPRDRQSAALGSQFYSGRRTMPAGIIKKIFFFGPYDVRALLEFKNDKLVDIRVSVLLETL
jgi:hypothetical protein